MTSTCTLTIEKRELRDVFGSLLLIFRHCVFTYGMTQGVGTSGPMPCDTDGDGLATMSEIINFVYSFDDPYLPGVRQHFQAYPENSDYALFGRRSGS